MVYEPFNKPKQSYIPYLSLLFHRIKILSEKSKFPDNTTSHLSMLRNTDQCYVTLVL